MFYQDPTKETENSYLNPVAGGRVVSSLDCYAGSLPIESSTLPNTHMLKHTCGEKVTDHYAGHQEVSRCHTRGKSQGTYIMYISAKCE